jgi:NifU-like protein involved in Fe-S cluster formation
MNAPLYTTEILRLAAALTEPRQLEREDGRAEVPAPTCGSRIETVVQVDDDGRIAAISQRVHACAFGQAASALLEQGATGLDRRQVSDALTALAGWLEGNDVLPGWPGIEALAPARSRKGRHGAILLPFRALLAALDSRR